MYKFPDIVDAADGRLHSNLILRHKGIRLTWIPKNMCSTLKFSFGLASGAIPATLEASFAANPAWIHSWMFPLEPHHHRDLEWPVSVAILRDPTSRLRSAIIEKGVYQRNDYERVFGERLAHYAHYSKKPLSDHTFSDLLASVRFFPDRMWDIHIKSQVGFLTGRYTHLLRLEDNPAAFFEERGVRIVTVDMHSVNKVPGEARIVGLEDRVSAVREEMAGTRRPIRFSPDLESLLAATVEYRFAADLRLWRSLTPA